MSATGIKECAAIFSRMQELRIKLIGGDTQDGVLAGMLEAGKDAMQPHFLRATSDPKISGVAMMDFQKRKAFHKKFRPADALLSQRQQPEQGRKL